MLEPFEQSRIMGGNHDRGPPLVDLQEELHCLLRHIPIQVACGLVSEDQDRVIDQGPRDGHPLLFPSG
jgi:hypothetical protein